MKRAKKKVTRMNREEIEELMERRGWSRTRLAAELDVTENTVHQWLSGRRNPGGPAVILMRLWLDQSRADAALQEQPVAG